MIWDFHLEIGDKHQGQFINNEKQGFGIFFWNDGDRYEGQFFKDKRDGLGTMIYKDGRTKEGIWRNDEFVGNNYWKINPKS